MKTKFGLGISLYLLPAIVIITVFFAFPLFFLLLTSLTNWRGGGFAAILFVGLKNYLYLSRNADFWQTMLNTAVWYAAGVVLHIPLCLITAMILSHHPFGWRFLRTVYFFPNVISQLVLAWMWFFIYKPDIGVLNGVLRLIGLEKLAIHWLGNPSTALGALIFTWLFNVGFFMIIFLAQIGTIAPELYDAAKIDGASAFQQEWFITIPMLGETIVISMLLVLTFTFRTFELPYIMTGGGPGTTSQILPLMMYKYVLTHDNNLANAIGFVMVVLGSVTVIVVRGVIRRREFV
jgi:raffinose/stachyose/melibiose transport system permease protein